MANIVEPTREKAPECKTSYLSLAVYERTRSDSDPMRVHEDNGRTNARHLMGSATRAAILSAMRLAKMGAC